MNLLIGSRRQERGLYLHLRMNQRLQRIFQQQFNLSPERWSDTLSPQHLPQWDSLGHLCLVEAIEAEFQLSLADGELTEMEDVAKIKYVLTRAGVT